ncbi:MAG: hypothetical protein H6858_05170 [Rhodospirillales bacterium]|nr:hypothetical protein [Rhodospirillales bacterium]
MKKLLLTAAVVTGAFCFSGSAYAAACGSVSTSSFDSIITTLNTELPSGSRSERRYKRNLIRATQNNINSSCSMAESLQNSMPSASLGSLSSFNSAFTGQLGQITGILNQVKPLVSSGSATQAQINQANALISQAKALSDQLKATAKQLAKQIAKSLQI